MLQTQSTQACLSDICDQLGVNVITVLEKWVVQLRGWRDSQVVSVLDLGSDGPRFEPVGRGW